MTIYLVAGEASADNHGAALMRALRESDVDPSTGLRTSLSFLGRGGPQMKAIAGQRFENWIEKSGVLGLWEVIRQYGYFRKQFRETLDEIESSKPDAVVLIDYPGFNLRLARALSACGPSRTGVRATAGKPKIIYYISPQVWAWNSGRIKKMARWLDLMLCIFPFESDLYNRSGLRTVFVGHPIIERLRNLETGIERDPNLIGLFPGSRSREVRKIFPILLDTVRVLRGEKPDLRFEVAAASGELEREMQQMLHENVAAPWPLEIKVGKTSEIMQRAFAGIVASGSATLEAAYFRLPFVLIYKVAWLTYLAGRLVVNVRYLGMPNVLADKEVVPEFIQERAQPHAIANSVLQLLNEASARARMVSEFNKIIAQLGQGGASAKAAKAIIGEIALNGR